jgi:hypothetical protein
MPTSRRRQIRQALTLTPAQRNFLLCAFDFTGDPPAFKNRTEEKKYWKKYRKELLDEWIAKNPGTRPDGFYRNEAELNLRKIGEGHYFGPDRNLCVYDIFEHEYDWLKRHGHLQPNEQPPPEYLFEKEAKLKQIAAFEKYRKSKIINFYEFKTRKSENNE